MANSVPVSSKPDEKKKVSLYEGSTQFRNWRYSPQQLAELRRSMNEAAVGVIRSTFEADEPGSSDRIAFLTADEELLLVKLYLTKITQLCDRFRFSEEVEATAVTYMKRFYLKNTVMDWHPKMLCTFLTSASCLFFNETSNRLTTLFLATKTTNNPISLESYTAHIPQTEPSDVLDLEFLVAQSLGFEFAVWHAHQALWGIWLDIQTLPDVTISLERSDYDTALNHVRASRLTDVELIYSPSQIALAAFSLTMPDVAEQWLAMKLPNGSSVIEDIKTIVATQGTPPLRESVVEVDRRLRLCKNPEKIVGSKAYLAKKAAEEKVAAERRTQKASENSEDVDPFENPEQRKPGLVDYDDDDDD